MAETQIKEIFDYTEDGINKTEITFSDKDKETEIVLKGSGKIKLAINA